MARPPPKSSSAQIPKTRRAGRMLGPVEGMGTLALPVVSTSEVRFQQLRCLAGRRSVVLARRG